MFRKTIFSIFFVLVLLCSVGLIAAAPAPVAAAPTTRNVPGTYTTIQAAINAASAGDIILVAATYNTSLETFPITVNKALTIRSVAGAASTNISPTFANFSAFYVTAAGVTIGGNLSTGFNISAGGRGGIYANISGGNRITVQGNTFCSYSANESRGMWFEKLWNGSVVTNNSFVAPKVGTGIMVVNADGATISNNTATGTGVHYCFLTFKAEAFYPDRNSGTPYAEYVATSPSLINNVAVTGNTIDSLLKDWNGGIKFGTSTKPSTHGEPQAQDLAVGSGGVRITNNVFIIKTSNTFGVGIDENEAADDDPAQIAHITGVENILINNNSFDSNPDMCGVYNGQETTVNALYNWWGDVAGPDVCSNPYYYWTNGDIAYGNVDYIPWLIHKTLNPGWNIFSAPIALGTTTDTVGEALNYWTSDAAKATIVYTYNGRSWVRGSAATALTPMVPVFLYISGSATATIDVLMSTSPSTPPSITLYQGWNLAGPGQLVQRPVRNALTSAYYGSSYYYYGGGANSIGYSQVISPTPNSHAWTYFRFISYGYEDEQDNPYCLWMIPTEGYWIYMVNPGTLAGWTFTPITEEACPE